jgi:hypothetical protein
MQNQRALGLVVMSDPSDICPTVIPNLNILYLAVMSDPNALGLVAMPDPSALGMEPMWDPSALGLAVVPDPWIMGLVGVEPIMLGSNGCQTQANNKQKEDNCAL